MGAELLEEMRPEIKGRHGEDGKGFDTGPQFDSLLKEGVAAELQDAEDGRILRDHHVHKCGPDSYDDILFL